VIGAEKNSKPKTQTPGAPYMSVLLLAAPPVCRASMDFLSAPSMHPSTSPPLPSHREVAAAAAAASRAILGPKAASPPPLLLPGSLRRLCCALLRASPLLLGSWASKGAAATAVAAAEAEAATCRPLTRRPPVTARLDSRGRSRGSRAANNAAVHPLVEDLCHTYCGRCARGRQ